MRERERLEDFKGGHVACRGCKRLLYFAPEDLAGTPQPRICCGIAYVPLRQQIDLGIYDRLQPGDFADEALVIQVAPPEPLLVESDPEPDDADADEEAEPEEAELADLVVTSEQVQARLSERKASIARRASGRHFS